MLSKLKNNMFSNAQASQNGARFYIALLCINAAGNEWNEIRYQHFDILIESLETAFIYQVPSSLILNIQYVQSVVK